jgi:hypothetical protein
MGQDHAGLNAACHHDLYIYDAAPATSGPSHCIRGRCSCANAPPGILRCTLWHTHTRGAVTDKPFQDDPVQIRLIWRLSICSVTKLLIKGSKELSRFAVGDGESSGSACSYTQGNEQKYSGDVVDSAVAPKANIINQCSFHQCTRPFSMTTRSRCRLYVCREQNQ